MPQGIRLGTLDGPGGDCCCSVTCFVRTTALLFLGPLAVALGCGGSPSAGMADSTLSILAQTCAASPPPVRLCSAARGQPQMARSHLRLLQVGWDRCRSCQPGLTTTAMQPAYAANARPLSSCLWVCMLAAQHQATDPKPAGSGACVP